ncbi:hypothetical protein AB0G60_25710 [Streptomyces angustmyceticus]|uniref:Uncharacterized protein n=1 Tax=Streptomyces angustmyceticus TaxID=285578 RepID=A0A5J4LPG6_9ACTN|nr:hypothetical protein [Streptomyces angustmyceticus]UAL68748.1 TMEM106 family protein [Streptomyces angustmyceticus]GES32338.1 hypothetical protein San01_48250 [Streptomyces angustmyceticus]
MPEITPARSRRCPDCDDFPSVAITTGQTNPDGTRKTLTVTCRTCQGTGTVPRHSAVTATSSGR